MGHWYDKKGNPVYEVLKSDGTGMRKPTKRDAKKDGLLPGVTDVLDVIAKHGLTKWLIRQPLVAATKSKDLDDLRDSDPEAWIAAINERADEEKDKAPDLGTQVHKGIEAYLQWVLSKKAAILTLDDEIKGFVRVFKEWFESKEIKINKLEHCVANPQLGYGGKLDFKGTWEGKECYIDWKTTRFRNGKATFYPSWGCQLAGYASADRQNGGPGNALLISVAIDSTDPGLIETKIWENNNTYWELFKLCMEIYKSPLGAGWDPAK